MKRNPIPRKLLDEVQERDNNTCQLTGEYTKEPPHHIIYGSGKRVHEIYNLITITSEIHRKIHFSNIPGEAKKYRQKTIKWSIERYGQLIVELAKSKGRRVV